MNFKRIIKKINSFLKLSGIDLNLMFSNIRGIKSYFLDFKKIKKENKKNFFGKINYYPALSDKNNSSGILTDHYFYQDLLIAQKIFKNNPQKHVDVGSRIDGFVSHVATFREIEVFDIRKQENIIDNVIFKQLDFMNNIPEKYIEYTDSISSLHAIEHFGLGRYGDKIDIDGHIKGLDSIKKMLKRKGIFYFSIPIGAQRIEFNAHRVFSLEYILKILKFDYQLISFSYISDNGRLYKNIVLRDDDIKNNLKCRFACGIFELLKK